MSKIGTSKYLQTKGIQCTYNSMVKKIFKCKKKKKIVPRYFAVQYPENISQATDRIPKSS